MSKPALPTHFQTQCRGGYKFEANLGRWDMILELYGIVKNKLSKIHELIPDCFMNVDSKARHWKDYLIARQKNATWKHFVFCHLSWITVVYSLLTYYNVGYGLERFSCASMSLPSQPIFCILAWQSIMQLNAQQTPVHPLMMATNEVGPRSLDCVCGHASPCPAVIRE